MDELKFYAEPAIWANAIRLYARMGSATALHIVYHNPEQGAQAEPFVTMSRESAQNLIDALWSAGMRPTEGTGSAGALAATQAHLKDMQTIAFDLLRNNNSGK